MKHYRLFLLLIGLLVLAFLADIAIGSVSLSIRDVWNTFIGSNDNLIYREIILNHRLPKALTAILAGASLSVAGVLNCKLCFTNPLAGPDVLGVTSGASLGVALLTLGTSSLPLWLITGWGQVTAAIIGAIGVLLLVIIVSIKIPQTISLLIIGMMFGNFAGAIVSILQSMSNPDTLKLFITWTFGSLSSVGWEQMSVMAPVIACGILTALLLQKQLQHLAAGKKLRQRIRVSVPRLRLWIILATALLAGNLHCFYRSHSLYRHITMPHVARGLFGSPNHRIILPTSMLCGAITLLVCDLISQLPGMQGTLPINAVTALFGSPIIVWIILRNSYINK